MSIAKLFKGIRPPRPQGLGTPSTLPPPERVFVPLRQHRGGVCQPLVEPGQAVAMGQVLGSAEAFESALVHSPVSGVVEAIQACPDPAGQPVSTVVVKNDGHDAWDESEPADVLADLEAVAKARPSRLLKRLRQAGLVRADSQGLPLHVELSPPMAPRSYMFMTGIPVVRPIDTLVIRAVDADPPVCPNQASLAALGPELEMGVLALARIIGAQRVVLALPGGAVPAEMASVARAREWEISQVGQVRYPLASDRLLVHSLTGREVPSPYGEPRDVGVLIEPLQSALDAGRALITGRPVLERTFVVAGDVAKPGAFRVRLGTPIAAVIAAAGGALGGAGKLIVGGPMLGLAHFAPQTPVTKETEGVYLQSAEHLRRFAEHPCIHCGRCVAACPVNLVPAELGKLCEFGHYEEAEERDLFHCIECGACAHVCPAQRPMVHYLRHGKSEVMARRMEQ